MTLKQHCTPVTHSVPCWFAVQRSSRADMRPMYRAKSIKRPGRGTCRKVSSGAILSPQSAAQAFDAGFFP